MMRLILVAVGLGSIVALWAAGVAQAQSEPVLRTQLAERVAVPGQILVLEVTVLVPTWMLEPPELPSFELPNVSIRLPEGSSQPVSEQIAGETWSGVTRAYQISPMIVGRFQIPPQSVQVTYADPQTRAPIVRSLPMDAVDFEGRAPAGAEGLDPFIAAEELTLEQKILGDSQDLAPGDAFERVVTARIVGASAIFLPQLIPPLEAPGIAAYPKEPILRDRTNRGLSEGERIESVTYLAEAGGEHLAPPVRLRWWNLRTKQIEVSEVPGIEITASGPPPRAPSTTEPRRLGAIAIAGALLLGIGAAAWRWAWPRIAGWRSARRERRLASEAFAFERLCAALGARDFGAALRAAERWSVRIEPVSESARRRLFEPLAPLGAITYGRDPAAPSKSQWAEASAVLRRLRRESLARHRNDQGRGSLPPLNPDSPRT